MAPPTPAPQITEFQVIGITNQSAAIQWKTNLLSRNYLSWGMGLPYSHSETPQDAYAPYFPLNNLQNNTQYFYNATSCTQTQTPACNSSLGSFTTLQTNILPANSTNTTAQPNVTTTPPANSRVNLVTTISGPSEISTDSMASFKVLVANIGGLEANYKLKVEAISSDPKTPSITILAEKQQAVAIAGATTGSAPSQTYDVPWNTAGVKEGTYAITATATVYGASDLEPTNNIAAMSVKITGTTKLPVISNVKVSKLTLQSATITWTTDLPSMSTVRYSKAGAPQNPVSNTDKVTAHSITLSNLAPNAPYSYNVQSCLRENADCTSYPEGSSLQFSTSSCSQSNYCVNDNTYASFSESNGTCKQDATVTCQASGCAKAGCSPDQGGCYSIPDNTKCSEQCTATVLKTSPMCIPTSNNMGGNCEYSELNCNEQNLCLQQPTSCGGKQYYCVKLRGKYYWSEDVTPCQVPEELLTSGKPVLTEYTPNADLQAIEAQPKKLEGMDVDPKLAKECVGSCNVLEAMRYSFEHNYVKEDVAEKFGVITNSKSALSEPKCISQKSPDSLCICAPGFEGSKSNFHCEVFPPVGGEYLITLRNEKKEGGTVSVVLEPGKKAVIANLIVPDRQNEDVFWVSIGLASILVFVAVGIIFKARREEKRMGRKLQRELDLLPKQVEELKYRMMKGTITPEGYQTASAALDKRRAELEARLKEWHEKHPQKRQKVAEELKGDEEDEEETAADAEKLRKLRESVKKESGEMDQLWQEIGGKRDISQDKKA